jgi:hypothetical protein
MTSPLWIASLLVATALAAPMEKEGAKISYAYAVDVIASTSTSTFNCYQQQNYRTAFVQVYQPTNGGSVNPNGPANIQNAISAGLGVEAFVLPQPVSSKQGSQQLDEAYSYVTSNGVNLRSIWLQVTSPINWPSSTSSNINFILSFLNRAQQRNLGVGIYTSAYDWQQITQGWTGWNAITSGVNLWYWHVTAAGPAGQTSQDFTDFANFGGFFNPLVKQFAQNINICSTYVNLDMYKTGNKIVADAAATFEKSNSTDNRPTIGLLMSSWKQ